jgi:hypothetical protein
MIALRMGSQNPEVRYLQRLLNNALVRDTGFTMLDEDSVFGRLTDTAVRRFQGGYTAGATRLVVDGVAGANTWRALGLDVEISWPLPQIGQNTGMSCWVVAGGLASGSMQSALPGLATFDPGNGGLNPDIGNLRAWADSLQMSLVPLSPGQIEGLVPYLRRGPLIIVGRWATGGLHAVVASGYFSAGAAYTRMLRVNNPAPLGRGSIEFTEFPNMTLLNIGFTPIYLVAH